MLKWNDTFFHACIMKAFEVWSVLNEYYVSGQVLEKVYVLLEEKEKES